MDALMGESLSAWVPHSNPPFSPPFRGAPMFQLQFKLSVPVLALALALTSCSSGSDNDSQGTVGVPSPVTLEVTDAPFAHGIVESAELWVDLITIRGPGGFQTLHSGSMIHFDLATLRNGITQELTTNLIQPGEYDQIRLRVAEASLRLINGDEFSTTAGNMHLTSTDTAGLKLNIDPPLQIGDGVARTLLLDFDLTKTFKAVPGNDPLNATFYQLLPVVKVSNLSQTGEFRGIVREDDGVGGLIGVGDVTVYVLQPGELDLGNAVHSTATDFEGHYAVLGVDPGTYDLVADLDGREARENGRSVSAGSVTTVDFVLP
jgi:hypothetical protein